MLSFGSRIEASLIEARNACTHGDVDPKLDGTFGDPRPITELALARSGS